jgi:Cdc6-like AAA superfamily ATPase
MAIPDVDEQRFREVLRRNLSPARAISDPSHLRGRLKLLKQIDRAFNSPGKHVFIYGDRGVGKSSLAQTAATIHQSSDGSPVVIACDQYADFYKLIADVARSALPPRSVIERRTSESKTGLRIPGLSHEVQKGLQVGIVPEVQSLNDAIVMLKYIAGLHSNEPVVIIDEFDQVKDNDNKKRFADLIKQVSDQEVGIRLIFLWDRSFFGRPHRGASLH